MVRKLMFLLCLFLILNCTKDSAQNTPLYAYVPTNTELILKINALAGIKDSISNNLFLASLEKLKPYRKALGKLSILDYVPTSTKGLLVFSDTDEVLYIGETVPLTPKDSISGEASAIEQLTLSSGSISKHTINDTNFFATISGSKFLIGSNEAVISASLEQADSDFENPVLKKLYTNSDETAAATVFVSLKNNDSLFSHLLKNDAELAPKEFAHWVSFDVSASKQNLLLNGISTIDSTATDYLSLFKNTTPLPTITASFAPYDTDAFLSYSFDNFGAFLENQQAFLQNPAPNDSLFSAVEEIGLIYMGNRKAIVLNTYGSESMTDFLVGIRKQAIDYQGNIILELSKTDFLNTVFNPVITNFDANYCTILENAFLFADKQEVLETLISDFNSGNTFDKSTTYDIIGEATASSATMLFIGNASYMDKLAKKHLQKNLFPNNLKNLFKGYSFAAQIVADGDFFLTNIALKKNQRTKKSSGTKAVFTTMLDSKIAMNPQIVTNHNTKKKEVVVQDEQNQLYLLSGEGEIIWKKQLSEKIQGTIHQVNLFKNGRLQFAFTTSSRLVVLDRNGKEVAALTKYFEGGNLNPLAVFDYAKNREYRLVVTQGNKVFMYDRKGKIVSGFKYTKANSPIVGAPKHLVIGNKDHIVFKLADGSLKILNRMGDVRVKVPEKFEFSENEVFIYKNQFTFSDKNGLLHQIDQNGKTNASTLQLNKEHGLVSTQKTLIYQNDNELSIKGKKVELDLGIYTRPKVFLIKNKIYISVTDIQNEKLYLFDSQAVPIKNFPVFGSGPADLASLKEDGKLALVAQKDDNSLILYQLN